MTTSATMRRRPWLRVVLLGRRRTLVGHGFYSYRYLFYPSSSTRRAARRASSSSTSPTATAKVPFLRRIVNGYTHLLDTFPLATKMVTSGIIAASGDLLCQCCFAGDGDDDHGDDIDDRGDGDGDRRHHEDRDCKAPAAATTTTVQDTAMSWAWDAERTGRFGMLGAFLVAPAVHHWYNALHRWTSDSNSTTRRGGLKLLAIRVAFDQLLFAPAFTSAWLMSLRTLEGQRLSEWKALWDDVPRIVVANWALWIPAQCVNFALVPLKFQVLFSNGVALAWNVYLSYTTSRHNSRREDNNRNDDNGNES